MGRRAGEGRFLGGRRVAIAAALILAAVASAVPASRAPRSGSRAPVARPGAGAEILWDRWGVPHIYASRPEDAFRAFGWAQMESHGNLLLRLYGQSRGRAAEYFGSEGLPLDRMTRTLGLQELGARWYREQTPEFRGYLDAFAAGINDFGRLRAAKLDPAVRAVLPVAGKDILTHMARVLALFLAGGALGQLPPQADRPGSNGWAIGPSRSVSGHPLLLVNPHLPWSGEMTLYEAQVTTRGYTVYGATMVGCPVLTMAFNDHLGWTHTVNTIDACDLYALTPEGVGYRFDGRERPFETRTETVKVRQQDGSLRTETLTCRRSVQGPVFERDGRLFALRAAGLGPTSSAGALEQWWRMGRARSLGEFRESLRRLQVPMFNVIYADRDGHTMLVFCGQVPRRPTGDARFWSAVVDGSTSATLWTDLLRFEDLPQVVDPPCGWVQNSNSVPWYMTSPPLDPARYPAYLSLREAPPGLREQRGLRMLRESGKLSLARLVACKYSTRSELADRLVEDLAAAARAEGNEKARQAAEVLRTWDRHARPTSRGAVLFERWLQVLRPGSPLFAAPYDPKRPLETPRGLGDPHAAVRALETAASELQARWGRLDVPWGDVYRLRRGKVDLPANGGPDALGIFRTLYFEPASDGRPASVAGDTFVAAVEFTTPLRAKVLMTYGNNSDPQSPHFGDQLGLSSRGRLRDAWLTRAQVEAHLERRTLFGYGGEVTER